MIMKIENKMKTEQNRTLLNVSIQAKLNKILTFREHTKITFSEFNRNISETFQNIFLLAGQLNIPLESE